jgi:hypothetical protein
MTSLCFDQNRPEVIDVGQRRPGDDRIAERAAEAVAVVVRKRVSGTDALAPGAPQRVRREIRTGNLLEAVRAVGGL